MTTIHPCHHGGTSSLTIALSTPPTILRTRCGSHTIAESSSAVTNLLAWDPTTGRSSTADRSSTTDRSLTTYRSSTTYQSSTTARSSTTDRPLTTYQSSTTDRSSSTDRSSTTTDQSFTSSSIVMDPRSRPIPLTTSSPIPISAASPGPINESKATRIPASSSSLLLISVSPSSIPTTADAVNAPSPSPRSRTPLVTLVNSSVGPSSPTSPPGPTQRFSQVAVAGIAGGGGFLLCFAVVMVFLFIVRRKRALLPEPIFANERRRSFRSIRVGRLVLLFKRRPIPLLGDRHTGDTGGGSRCSTIRSTLGLSRSLRGSDGYPQNPLVSPYMQIEPSSQVLRNNIDIPSSLPPPTPSTAMRESEHSIDVDFASILVHAPTAPNSQTSTRNYS